MKAFLPACALLLAAATAGNALALGREPLGRLFLTPEKREALERQRAANALESAERSEEPSLLVNGQVRRSSGKRTMWINGQMLNDDQGSSNMAGSPSSNAADQVTLETSRDVRASVKIGETLNRGTQETISPLGDGRIVINSRSRSERTR